MVVSVFSSAVRPLGPAALVLLGMLLWLCAISGTNAEETSFYRSVSCCLTLVSLPSALCRSSIYLNFLLLTLTPSCAQRPDISPPVFKVELSNPQKLSPGYYFITPYEATNPGPYIFDNDGVRRIFSPATKLKKRN
jgi:hypothetical protein